MGCVANKELGGGSRRSRVPGITGDPKRTSGNDERGGCLGHSLPGVSRTKVGSVTRGPMLPKPYRVMSLRHVRRILEGGKIYIARWTGRGERIVRIAHVWA